ncbi:MAG: Helix-turn-helix domain [Gemmatimonadetes bacterium]|nr:Helix-turn-helix domain [Gemmatimonadota bacterium]
MASRERRDIEQEEIATAVGVTPQAYSRWEKGLRIPKEGDVLRLAAFFGVAPAYLRYGVSVAPNELLASARQLTEPELDRADVIAARAKRSPKKKPAAKKPQKRAGGKG